MKYIIKNDVMAILAIILTMTWTFHGQAVAGDVKGHQPPPQVDALADRIADARKSYANSVNDMNELMALGKSLYLGGVQRPDEPWLKESYGVWDDLLTRYPQEPLVQAYSGSVRVLQARDAFFPWTKGMLLKQGQRLLAAARSQSPGNMQVIWLEAVTAYHLPEKFGQREIALRNFAKLAEALEAMEGKGDENRNKQGKSGTAGDDSAVPPIAKNHTGVVMNDNLEPAMKASVWYFRGLSLAEHSEMAAATTAWRRSVQTEPQSAYAKTAARCLLEHTSQETGRDAQN